MKKYNQKLSNKNLNYQNIYELKDCNVSNSFADQNTEVDYKNKKFKLSLTKTIDPIIILHANHIDDYRIPRCSTGFDNNIPGYFNTNYGKIIKYATDFYNKYDLDALKYFDSKLIDHFEIKRNEDQKYIKFFNKKK